MLRLLNNWHIRTQKLNVLITLNNVRKGSVCLIVCLFDLSCALLISMSGFVPRVSFYWFYIDIRLVMVSIEPIGSILKIAL